MTANDENSFMKVLQVDDETIEALDKIVAMDRGEQPLMPLDNETEEFVEFAKQTGILELPESAGAFTIDQNSRSKSN